MRTGQLVGLCVLGLMIYGGFKDGATETRKPTPEPVAIEKPIAKPVEKPTPTPIAKPVEATCVTDWRACKDDADVLANYRHHGRLGWDQACHNAYNDDRNIDHWPIFGTPRASHVGNDAIKTGVLVAEFSITYPAVDVYGEYLTGAAYNPVGHYTKIVCAYDLKTDQAKDVSVKVTWVAGAHVKTAPVKFEGLRRDMH
jgi:hypothetical protein